MTTTELTIKSNSVVLKREEMNLFMEMAKQFSKAGAFPSKAPEALFVLMKAGQEMGMSEIESLNSLYIVNGKIEPYGKAMVAMIVEDGYQLSYVDETDSQVTVVATKGKHVIRETVMDTDQIIKNSRATKFSKKNKMRFHGIRTILNFHLAHLIRSTADLFEVDAVDHKNITQDAEHEEVKMKVNLDECRAALQNVTTVEGVRELYEQYKLDGYEMDYEVDAVFTQRALQIQENTDMTSKLPKKETPKQSEPVHEVETVTVEAEEVPPVVTNTPKTDMKVVKDEAKKTEPEPVNTVEPEPVQAVDKGVEYTAKLVTELASEIATVQGLTDLYNQIKAVQNVGPFLNILGARRKEINSKTAKQPQNA